MIELTLEQRRAVAQQGEIPPRAVDPRHTYHPCPDPGRGVRSGEGASGRGGW
jgi:hypothetical protein